VPSTTIIFAFPQKSIGILNPLWGDVIYLRRKQFLSEMWHGKYWSWKTRIFHVWTLFSHWFQKKKKIITEIKKKLQFLRNCFSRNWTQKEHISLTAEISWSPVFPSLLLSNCTIIQASWLPRHYLQTCSKAVVIQALWMSHFYAIPL